MATNFDLVLSVVALVGGVVKWGYEIRATMLRTKIKTDLEVMELLKKVHGSEDARFKRIDRHVTRLMGFLYVDRSAEQTRSRRWGDIALGALCILGVAALVLPWPISGARPGWPSAITAAFLSFMGLGAFLNGFAVSETTERTQDGVAEPQ